MRPLTPIVLLGLGLTGFSVDSAFASSHHPHHRASHCDASSPQADRHAGMVCLGGALVRHGPAGTSAACAPRHRR
jgi:hypothetical protein